MAKLKLGKLKYRDVIIVTWVDAGGSGGWAQRDEAPEHPVEMDQPCVYMKHTKEAIYIAQAIPKGHEGEHMVLAPSLIPLGCVLKVRKL